MNKRALVESTAAKAGTSFTTTEAVVDAVFTAIAGALADGEAVTIPGFGTFEVRERAARTGRNPQTGAVIEIAARVAPAFKPAAGLKRVTSAG